MVSGYRWFHSTFSMHEFMLHLRWTQRERAAWEDNNDNEDFISLRAWWKRLVISMGTRSQDFWNPTMPKWIRDMWASHKGSMFLSGVGIAYIWGGQKASRSSRIMEIPRESITKEVRLWRFEGTRSVLVQQMGGVIEDASKCYARVPRVWMLLCSTPEGIKD